ncbi:twin-arginine translocase TatA/TatE family subunit [Streptacidiphilus monticola]|uniref:Twin-arginine translocase TatA/TatE family subunit n=1 Tax=Streptacidiphilus monticola TaxID=2161674 RepID=A0ABW1G8X4_9ACTN
MLENRALDIIVTALVVLVLFGATRLPDSARALAKSLRILKADTHALRTDDHEPAPDAPAAVTAQVLERPGPTAPAHADRDTQRT